MRAHQKSAQPCNHPIRNPEIRSTLPAAIENQQLMSNQRGFGNNATQPTRLRESNYGNDYMKKKGKNIAHAGMVSNFKTPAIQHN